MKRVLLAACLLPLSPLTALAQEDLAALALSLVNEARAEEGLDPLEQDERLAEAAEAHAKDMLARGYYGHVSPEGETARDRFLEAGGRRWSVVAENLATCEGCETPPGPEQIRSFQTGWMQSPGHRENILGRGLDRFGFSLAAEDGSAFAVQMFAGPGTSPAAPAGEAGELATATDLGSEALDALNAARAEAGRSDLHPSETLNSAARAAAEEAVVEEGDLQLPADLFGLLPEGAAGWAALSIAAEACGGCGAFPIEREAAYFMERLLPAETASDFTHVGFALAADRSGRKIAVAVYGRRTEE